MTGTAEKQRYWIWLAGALGPCNSKLRGLLRRFDSPERVYRERESAELRMMLAPKEYGRVRGLGLDESDGIICYCEQNGVAVVPFDDCRFPDSLRDSSVPPAVIYVTGDVSALGAGAAVAGVGSRYSTQYGRDAVRLICEPLSASGITLVSGMAAGIDTEVHKAALNAGGRTVAVLGTGIDVTYPARNRELRPVIEQNGAVVSEYPPFTQNAPYLFPMRNRIIAGLARAVVIFEAAKRSGTMITAGWALDDGKDVFAVPGSIFSAGSEGTNRLIGQGAIPALSAADILERMGVAKSGCGDSAVPRPNAAAAVSLTGIDGVIYDILKDGERSLDVLVETAGRSSGELLSALTMLELDGVVAGLPGHRYRLV